MRNRGIDAVLDQWDLKPGDDLPQFMEQNLIASDFAIMVCTQRYVEKANAGEGGVGYEKMIMTASSLSKISSNKVIPIVREPGAPPTPTFLSTKLYIDFSDDNEIEFALDELLRALLNAPLYEKPKIGADPFQPLHEARPNRTADGIREVMIIVAECFDETDDDFVSKVTITNRSQLHRLTFDKYLAEAFDADLLIRDRVRSYQIRLSEKGIAYLNKENIVEA